MTFGHPGLQKFKLSRFVRCFSRRLVILGRLPKYDPFRQSDVPVRDSLSALLRACSAAKEHSSGI
jgi:hypothetical protein